MKSSCNCRAVPPAYTCAACCTAALPPRRLPACAAPHASAHAASATPALLPVWTERGRCHCHTPPPATCTDLPHCCTPHCAHTPHLPAAALAPRTRTSPHAHTTRPTATCMPHLLPRRACVLFAAAFLAQRAACLRARSAMVTYRLLPAAICTCMTTATACAAHLLLHTHYYHTTPHTATTTPPLHHTEHRCLGGRCTHLHLHTHAPRAAPGAAHTLHAHACARRAAHARTHHPAASRTWWDGYHLPTPHIHLYTTHCTPATHTTHTHAPHTPTPHTHRLPRTLLPRTTPTWAPLLPGWFLSAFTPATCLPPWVLCYNSTTFLVYVALTYSSPSLYAYALFCLLLLL